MARRGGGGGKGRSGVKEVLLSIVMVSIIAGGVLGWSRANNINSYESFRDYFKSWSDGISECGYIPWITGECKLKDYNYIPGRGNGSTSGEATFPKPPMQDWESEDSLDDIAVKLNGLTIKDSKKNPYYDRAEWKHWTGSPCNTRQQVLIDQGEEVETGDRCKILSGVWVDPFSLVEFTDSSELDIDHVIPLSWANRNGGASWSKEKKEAFANDFDHLLAVSAKENRAKGDKGPGDYLPPNKDYYCSYSLIWINTLDKYDLSIPQKDFSALEKAFKTCS